MGVEVGDMARQETAIVVRQQTPDMTDDRHILSAFSLF